MRDQTRIKNGSFLVQKQFFMMAAENPPAVNESSSTAAEVTARAVSRRYEALISVRSKAMTGKGAWYWFHLEPVLLHDPDSGLPNTVKLRCSLCNAVFSASNPSRTASEHLKRGTCPNFTAADAVGPSSAPTPISSRKVQSFPALPPPHRRLILSGGKEDLGALALLEDSVKRLKSPRGASPVPALSKPLADAALSLLADWLLESTAAASPSSLNHPKIQSFFHQVGLPSLSPRRLVGPILESRFREAAAESSARSKHALFFQLDTSGWNSPAETEQTLICLSVNLPNGTTVFHRAIIIPAPPPPSDYAEAALLDAVSVISAGGTHRCAGIVSDRFKSKALRNIESRNPSMANVHCQLQALRSLGKDLAEFFHPMAARASLISQFFNAHSPARAILQKYQLQVLGRCRPLHSRSLLEDLTSSSRALQLAVVDEDFKLLGLADSKAREVSESIRDAGLWNELRAVHSLLDLVDSSARELEAERPLLGRCLPLWDELRGKIRAWRASFDLGAAAADPVDRIIELRFGKSYHPAWSAAFVLDPLYLIKEAGGKYLPPFKFLTPEQEKDVDRIVTRLVSREEAHIVLMELMKWRTEGLDPLYAQAVQVKQQDPATGKMRVANPQSSRLVWETCLSELKSLGRVAVRLIFLHATACRVPCGPALLRAARRSTAAAERVEKMIFISAQARFERRGFSDEEEMDAQIMAEDLEEEEDASSG